MYVFKMYILCAMLSALMASAFCSLSEENSSLEDRVVEGKQVDIKDYPYLVSIQNEKGEHICSGSLVTDVYVITAAHCVPNNKLTVKAGSSFCNKTDGVVKKVARVDRHPNFNKHTLDYDIAVVTLRTEFDLGPTINIIDLPDPYQEVKPGTKMEVTGWGNSGGDVHIQLRKMDVSVMKRDACQKALRKVQSLTENMICTSFCSKEPGSPLVNDNVLYGVVSWGGLCGDAKNPTVYANVPLLAEFIQKITDA